MLTHSWVGINPFLPIPAAAMRSRLEFVSIDNDLLSFIFPLAFSEIGDKTVSDDGDMNDLVRISSDWRGVLPTRGAGSSMLLFPVSLSKSLAFSAPGFSDSASSTELLLLPLASFPSFFACSSLANCTRLISRRPLASVNVPRSSKILWEDRMP